MSDHRAQHAGGIGIVGLGLIVSLAVLGAGTFGCRHEGVTRLQLDTSKDQTHQSGPWTYEYSITLKGTRSQGYHGKLLYNGREVPEPASINDFYETPWGPLYWVGEPVVPFREHGWMPGPMGRGPEGHILMDPARLAGQVFTLRVEVLASEELATPDRIETDPQVRAALRPFDVNEAHVQRSWFSLSHAWESLHDTKRWGHLEVRVAPADPNRPLALEFRSTGDFSVTTSTPAMGLAALVPPERSGKSEFVNVPPQVGAVRTIKCALTPVVGDALDLFLICRVEKSRKQP